MTQLLARIPLVGLGPITVLGAIAVTFLVLAVLVWRRRKVWRWVFVALFVVMGLGTAADVVNNSFSYYDSAADLLGLPTYPTVEGVAGGATGADVTPQPNGAVTQITVPDTQSHFGNFAANVWLPPQYFTNPRQHFPVVMLLHGNPGQSTDMLTSVSAAATGLAVANSGNPVILVMPTVLQNGVTGDSLCLDTQSQGNAETYVVKDVVAAMDGQLRTEVDPKKRGIGGTSMGGYCALNLGLKHPDVFSVVLDFSGETVPSVDALPGGLPELFGANYQQQADANNPTKYYTQLNGSAGPAIWMDAGTGDPVIVGQMNALLPQLKSRGFIVEFHTRPGIHNFATWTEALKEALPWAAQRFGPPPATS